MTNGGKMITSIRVFLLSHDGQFTEFHPNVIVKRKGQKPRWYKPVSWLSMKRLAWAVTRAMNVKGSLIVYRNGWDYELRAEG